MKTTELIKKTKHFWAAMITLQALFFIIVFVGAKPDTSDIIAVEFGFIVMCAIYTYLMYKEEREAGR